MLDPETPADQLGGMLYQLGIFTTREVSPAVNYVQCEDGPALIDPVAA